VFKVGQATANLEGAHRRVVLVLDPAVGAQALTQQCPAVLRRGLEFAVDDACGGFDVGQGGQLHGFRWMMPGESLGAARLVDEGRGKAPIVRGNQNKNDLPVSVFFASSPSVGPHVWDKHIPSL
jgi:hypothetical protein